jgi:hypothetical protein
MYRFLCVVALFALCFPAVHVSGAPPNLQWPAYSINKTARLYRIDPQISPEDDQKRRQAILDRFCSQLYTYTDSDLDATITSFVQDVLREKIVNYHIVNAASTFLRGKSSDQVFLLYNHEEQLHYVVKVFRNPHALTSKFLPEISALELITALHLPFVKSVKPIAVALCVLPSDAAQAEYGLLLETAAAGMRIDHYVYAIANYAIASPERETIFHIAEKAFWRMGESLGRLHATRSQKLSHLPLPVLAKMQEKMRAVLDNPFIVTSLMARMPFENFYSYLNSVIVEAEQVWLHLTYQHGDAHLGNMFYDEWGDTFCFIDDALLYKSVDIYGNPLLDGSSDLLRADEHFRRKAFGFLSEKETEHLISTYYAGYQQVSGSLPDPRLVTFYRAYLKLNRLLVYWEYQKEPDLEKRARNEAIFNEVLEYFSTQCHFADSAAA